MNFRPILYVNGILLLILSASMLIPAIIDLSNDSPDWQVFAASQIATAFAGFLLLFSNRQPDFKMTLKETFFLTTSSWVVMAAFGAIPFCLGEHHLSYTDAFFEAMSGITTTGATVMSGLDSMAHGILFWRVLLHWLGGIGFLVIALAVLPLLSISGMQIFKTQSFSDIDKFMPSASQMSAYILLIYIGLTVIGSVLFHYAGMNTFDALSHAMSAVSTGGFANYDASLGYFNSLKVDFVATLCMLSGALPFALYLRFLRGDRKAIIQDSQVRAYMGIIIFMSLLIMVNIFMSGQMPFISAMVKSLFTVTSIITTTGFVSGDYTTWGSVVIAVTFICTFIGSCSGSTAGGIKIFRLQILWDMLVQQLSSLMSPNGVFKVRYNGKIVTSDVQAAVAGFFFVYIATWLFFGFLLMLCNIDFTTAFSGSITALSNVGPGLGNFIGPAGNFSGLHDLATWILSLAMLVGRLEFMTLLVLLSVRFWKE